MASNQTKRENEAIPSEEPKTDYMKLLNDVVDEIDIQLYGLPRPFYDFLIPAVGISPVENAPLLSSTYNTTHGGPPGGPAPSTTNATPALSAAARQPQNGSNATRGRVWSRGRPLGHANRRGIAGRRDPEFDRVYQYILNDPSPAKHGGDRTVYQSARRKVNYERRKAAASGNSANNAQS